VKLEHHKCAGRKGQRGGHVSVDGLSTHHGTANTDGKWVSSQEGYQHLPNMKGMVWSWGASMLTHCNMLFYQGDQQEHEIIEY